MKKHSPPDQEKNKFTQETKTIFYQFLNHEICYYARSFMCSSVLRYESC